MTVGFEDFVLEGGTTLSNSHTATTVDASRTAASSEYVGPTVSVPRSQLYYWTRKWQEDEAIAVAELGRGQGLRFADPQGALRWLLSAS